MAHQHRGGHCAHTAGHRGNSLHDGFCLIKAHIAAELALFVDVDAHIHHDLTFPQAIGPDGSPPSHGDHQHIGLPAEGRQVPGAGIAEGHGGVLPVQHHGSGLAHHQAAAHDHGPFAGQRHVVVFQDLKAGLRRAGRITDGHVGEHTSHRAVRDAVHVLFRSKRLLDPAVIEPLWQGPEDQAPVNRCIPIDLPDHIQQFLLRNIFRQMELPHLHANLTAPGDDPLFIRNVILPRADPYHSQCGHDALFLQRGTARGVCFVHGGHHGRTLQDLSHFLLLSLI